MTNRKTQQLEGLYGPCYQFSDSKVSDHVVYQGDDNQKHTGVIVWVVAPTQDDPLRYIVETEEDSFPEILYQSDIVHMTSLSTNEQVREIAFSAIAQGQAEGLKRDDIVHIAVEACVRAAHKQGLIGDTLPEEVRSELEALVKEAMNTEPTLVRCPYCLQMHQKGHVKFCPLKS